MKRPSRQNRRLRGVDLLDSAEGAGAQQPEITDPADEELVRLLKVGLAALDKALPAQEPGLHALEAALAAYQASVRRRLRLETAGFLGAAAFIFAIFLGVIGWAPRLFLPLQAACLAIPLLLSLRLGKNGREKRVKP